MKAFYILGLLAVALAAPAVWAAAQEPAAPAPDPASPAAPAAPADEPAADPEADDQAPAAPPEQPPAVAEPAETPPAAEPAAPTPVAPPAVARPIPSRPTRGPATGATPSVAGAAGRAVGEEKADLRLNFRGAPLELVLNYLSEAAGFIIILETQVSGKLDVWSNQPLTKDEAVELLNRVLAKNGYAAIRTGRTLTIVNRDEARNRNIPVRSGADPAGIPQSEEIVTQIIPVRFINAVQLTRDLQPLFPTSAAIASNEGGNAVVVTDTLANIRRIAQIIRALDTSISSVSAVRVFPLQYADAKALATVVRDLFQPQSAAARGGGTQQQQRTFRGFGGPGGGGGFPGAPGIPGGGQQGGNNNAGGSSPRVSTPSVVAVADERSNALVVSAPEEQMPVIEDLVHQVDTPMDDITELRVFRLRHADPQEMSDLLEELFPDPTSNQAAAGRGQVRFGGPGGGNLGGGFAAARFGGTGTDTSARLQKQTQVTAVPDLRTRSVVVSASRDLMQQIAGMVEQLDADPARKQKVFVYSVENTDPTAVEEVLRSLFETQNTASRNSSSRNSTTQGAGNQLNNRARTQQNQGNNRSSFGGNTGGGGTTGNFGR